MRTLTARSRALLVTSLATCGVMSIASTAQAQTRVFADAFEDGAADAWENDGAKEKCAVVESALDGGTAHGGTHMAECNWNGLVDWPDPQEYSTLMLASWDYTNELLVRFWVRYDADVDHTQGAKLFRLAGGFQESFYLGAQMELTGGPLVSVWEHAAGPQGPVFWGDDTPFGNGAWHQIEIYIRASDANDGILRVWQDDVLKQEATDLATVTAGNHWYPLYLTSNWSNNPGWEHDDTNHTYWDDFEVYSDAQSGTPATGSLADGTATVEGTGGEGGGASTTTTTGSGPTGSGSTGSGSGGPAGSSAAGSGSGGGGDSDADDDEGGCNCATSDSAPSNAGSLLWLVVGWLATRRRAGRY